MRLRFWRRRYRSPWVIPQWALVFYGYRPGDRSSVRMWQDPRSDGREILIDLCGKGWSQQYRRVDCAKIILMRDLDQGTVLALRPSNPQVLPWIAVGVAGATDELQEKAYRLMAAR